MLALDVNLLTTKLKNQSLEENQSVVTTVVTTATPSSTSITLINKDTGFKLSESAQAKLGGVVQGKKLWTVALNKDTPGSAEHDTSVSQPFSHNTRLRDGATCHNVPYSSEQLEREQSAVERPKKRHCRSMTVPQETEINIPPAKSSWQPQGSGLWKPVGLHCPRPLGGASTKWDVRSVQWTPPDSRYYEFLSLAHRRTPTGHVTPDDLLTPPESPVPRPNSVYSDGAISPFTSDSYYWDYQNKLYCTGYEGFRNRSLSVEDKISSTITSCSSASVGGVVSSIPSSPHHRHRIPRCRSQPSFYDRKSGRRRRRDCRPTLNFNKMTETAYSRPTSSDAYLSPKKESSRSMSFHSELENVMSLMPIASSPRDTDLSAIRTMASNKRNSPIHELVSSDRDNIMLAEEDASTINEPVKLLGDMEDDMEMFQMTEELDLEQIEND